MSNLQTIYFSISLIVVIFLCLIFLLFLPAARGIVEESAQLSLQRKELASIELLADNFENFEQNYSFYEEGLKEMEDLLNQESLIDPEIPVNFIDLFKKQATELNLDLRISPVSFQEKKTGGCNYLLFRIDGTGEPINAMKFLAKLENSRWLVEVMSLSVVKQKDRKAELMGEQEKGGLVGINVLIKVYAQD